MKIRYLSSCLYRVRKALLKSDAYEIGLLIDATETPITHLRGATINKSFIQEKRDGIH